VPIESANGLLGKTMTNRRQKSVILEGHGRLALPDGDLAYVPGFFSARVGDRLLSDLSGAVRWTQPRITLFGKQVCSPRLAAWYGDQESVYRYSGLVNQPLPWFPELLEIRRRVQQYMGLSFDGVLLNLYRTGQDSMGWHSDDEKELGENPVIASVSLGAPRRFLLRHRRSSDLPVHEVGLEHGSLLLMQGTTQQNWRHSVPRMRNQDSPRLNLTFRRIN
jgi:alkylated DNA repair dioxygenase AlkB